MNFYVELNLFKINSIQFLFIKQQQHVYQVWLLFSTNANAGFWCIGALIFVSITRLSLCLCLSVFLLSVSMSYSLLQGRPLNPEKSPPNIPETGRGGGRDIALFVTFFAVVLHCQKIEQKVAKVKKEPNCSIRRDFPVLSAKDANKLGPIIRIKVISANSSPISSELKPRPSRKTPK